jgi:hypothetical protein
MLNSNSCHYCRKREGTFISSIHEIQSSQRAICSKHRFAIFNEEGRKNLLSYIVIKHVVSGFISWLLLWISLSSVVIVISLMILILIFQSSHLLQQTGFATIPNTWDFIRKTSVSCWGNQYIWHRVKYEASTKGLNVNVAMVATRTEIWVV